MASNELKEIRKAMTKEAIREHQMAKTGGTQTDLFTCGKCKKKNCTYTQVSLPAPTASTPLTSAQDTIRHCHELLLLRDRPCSTAQILPLVERTFLYTRGSLKMCCFCTMILHTFPWSLCNFFGSFVQEQGLCSTQEAFKSRAVLLAAQLMRAAH